MCGSQSYNECRAVCCCSCVYVLAVLASVSVTRLRQGARWSESMVLRLRAEAGARGVDASRLIFAPPQAHKAHLARYAAVDVFLDTRVYGAHTTAADALWAGVPVVTMEGAGFQGRVAASLLRAIGCPELVVASLKVCGALLHGVP